MILHTIRISFTALAAILAITSVFACASESSVRNVEVTREVTITREVPVTVETVATVEVTREVTQVQEVPVTVEVFRTVEVTREPQRVEVTREVPVTRVVAATPTIAADGASAVAPTVSRADMAATPTPTAVPAYTPSPVAVASAPDTRFGSWRMETEQYGSLEVNFFRSEAVTHESPSDAPQLTYQCDNRGGRSFYIDWYQPLATEISEFPRYSDDPFQQFRDNDLDAIAALAGSLLDLTDDLPQNRDNTAALDRMWRHLERRWQLNSESSRDLVDRVRKRNHQGVSILLDFYAESPDATRRLPFGPPVLASIEGRWVVLSEYRTQANAGLVGQLTRAYRDISPPSVSGANTTPMVVATVVTPEQPVEIIAKWKINDLDKVISYCRIQAR